MPIVFLGDCGKKFQAAETLAGRKTRCPQCQTVLEIPRPAAEPASEADFIQSALAAGPAVPKEDAATFELEPLASPRSPMIDLSAGGSVPPAAPVSRRLAPQVVAATSKSRESNPGGRPYFLPGVGPIF